MTDAGQSWNQSETSLIKRIPTCGGVGVVADLPPDMISSVMSRPPWLGSRILICQEKEGKCFCKKPT